MSFLSLCLTTLGSFGVLFLMAKSWAQANLLSWIFLITSPGLSIGSIAAEMATELESLETADRDVIYGGVTRC